MLSLEQYVTHATKRMMFMVKLMTLKIVGIIITIRITVSE